MIWGIASTSSDSPERDLIAYIRCGTRDCKRYAYSLPSVVLLAEISKLLLSVAFLTQEPAGFLGTLRPH